MAKWNLPNKKLYLLTSVNRHAPQYDVVMSMVVRADSEAEARFQGSLKAMDEKADTWMNHFLSTCEEISLNGDVGVICVDANNG